MALEMTHIDMENIGDFYHHHICDILLTYFWEFEVDLRTIVM